MAERIPQTGTSTTVDTDDLIREASAMTLLMAASEDPDLLADVRRGARALYDRSLIRRTAGAVLVEGEPPTRAELDALWALVPADRLEWAHGIVDRVTATARRFESTATPQAIEMKDNA